MKTIRSIKLVNLGIGLALMGLVFSQALEVVAFDPSSLQCGVSSTPTPPLISPMTEEPLPVNGGDIKSDVIGAELPGRPTAVAFGPDDTLYVAVAYATAYPLNYFASLYGSVYQLVDGEARLLVDGLNHPTGLAFLEGDLYISELDSIIRVQNVQGTHCDGLTRVVSNLPFDESHWTNGLASHEGRIYASTGYVYHPLPSSRLDLRGTIFSIEPDGSDLRIEATGLRNSYAIGFDDQGRMWSTDNGPNVDFDPGIKDESQVYPDELNLIVPGGDYGFHPNVRETNVSAATVAPSPDVCMKSSCGTPPVAAIEKHTAPTGVVWDAERGVVLLGVSAWGQVQTYDPETDELGFLFWNLNIPTGIAIGPDGALYVAEWGANRVVRIELPEIPAQ